MLDRSEVGDRTYTHRAVNVCELVTVILCLLFHSSFMNRNRFNEKRHDNQGFYRDTLLGMAMLDKGSSHS